MYCAQWWRRLKNWLFPEKPLGQKGEEAAARYLRYRGYRILVRGVRSARGEIDLVALDGKTIVFVEVKTRQSDEPISPAEGVDTRKQSHILRSAQEFLHRHQLEEYPCRFDVVAVTWPAGRRRPAIEHFPGAFQAGQ